MDEVLTYLSPQELEEAGLLEEAITQSREDLRLAAESVRRAGLRYRRTAERDETLLRYAAHQRIPEEKTPDTGAKP